MNILLKNNADVDAKGKTGQTALHFASKNGVTDCMKILLENNADV